jgi:hypothetical protein
MKADQNKREEKYSHYNISFVVIFIILVIAVDTFVVGQVFTIIVVLRRSALIYFPRLQQGSPF